ncbi:MAG TPA: TolC family protein [Bacteroidetes bacterium]|nr:TolC family protein [Bacteroidota bacterium]
MNRSLLSALFLLWLTPLPAQEVYTLGRCLETGLENNFSLIIARNRETISGNNYTRGNAGYLPSLDLTGRAGGTVASTQQVMTNGSESSSSGVHNMNANAGLSLGWTLFDGFSVRTTYQKLGELQQAGMLNTRLAVENLMAGIASAYYHYIQQIQLYRNLQVALDLSRERVRIDEERYLLGSGSRLQLLQSKVYFNADSSRLARQSEVVRNLQVRLNELMAVEDLTARIVPSDSTIRVSSELNFEELLKETLEKNTSLLIASSNRVISEYDRKLIAAQTYPYLNFSGGYTYGWNAYGAGQVDRQTTGTMHYGLTLGMNLFDGLNRQRREKNALIEVENRELQYQEVEQSVRADLITVYNGYTNNLRLLKLEKENLKTAAENLEIAMERYKLGSLSGLELREVQLSLLDAEERLLSVQYQARLAEISLLQIAGRMEEYLE